MTKMRASLQAAVLSGAIAVMAPATQAANDHSQHKAQTVHHEVHRLHQKVKRERHLLHKEHKMLKQEHRVWKHAPARFRKDVLRFRGHNYAHRRFHWHAYNRPHGWYHRHWSYGERLPSSWWRHQYWINEWSSFGLFAPPAGYVWVRVGPDAMLVDSGSGIILRVVYNLFY